MPKLIISGVTYELVEQVITVGRAPDNTIHLDDPSVSGRHAELRAAGKAYQLRDLGSTNGTRVNGSPTGEIILHSGDRIRFGAVDARFEGDMPMERDPAAAGRGESRCEGGDNQYPPGRFCQRLAIPDSEQTTRSRSDRSICSGSNRLIGIVGGNRRSADNARADAVTKTCHPERSRGIP